jgi:LmbE family N-acetylglucosaminyl deacetylase
MTDLAARIADVKPVDLDITERLKNHEFAVEYAKAQAEEIGRLAARIEELEKALEDAAECVESWGGYASTYFQDKHDLAGDIERIRTAARALKGETKSPSQSSR